MQQVSYNCKTTLASHWPTLVGELVLRFVLFFFSMVVMKVGLFLHLSNVKMG